MGGYYLIDIETNKRAIALAQPMRGAGIDGLALAVQSDLCEGVIQKALLATQQRWATPQMRTHAVSGCGTLHSC